MNRDYHRYLTPFWVTREREIEETLQSPQYYYRNPAVTHAMICRGGYIGGVNVQSLHMWRWQDHTGLDIRNMESFCELGGGYGLMCRMIRGVTEAPYRIIDLPVTLSIQQHFLRHEPGILYHPIADLKYVPPCDMFISIYALNETAQACVDAVLDAKFFGAKHFLVGFYNQDTEHFTFAQYRDALSQYGDLVTCDETTTYLFK